MSARNLTCVGVCIAGIFGSWPVLAAKNDLAEKLREAARLPSINLRLGFKTDESATKDALEADLKKHVEALNGTDADAEHYLEIAAIYRGQKREKEGDAARARAVEILNKRLAARPNDAQTLAGLSRARIGEKRWDEAERLARRAVEAGATNAEAWYALSCCLDFRAMRLLGDVWELPTEQMLELILRKAPLDAVQQAEPVAAEALRCMNKALSFAPGRVDYYYWRPQVRMRHNLLKLRASGEAISTSNVKAALWSNESIGDYKKAAELTFDDPESAFAVWHWEMAKSNIVAGTVDGQEFARKNPALLADITKRLQELGQSTNKTTALAALRRLSVLKLFTLDYAGEIDVLRQIINLDPSAEDAWDALIGILGVSDQNAELVKVCDERVKRNDTARNRLLLAKAYDSAGVWDKVEPQIRKSLELDPNDVTANLCLAVVMLKESKLEEAEALLQKVRRVDTDPDHAQQLAYVQGLYWGIKGMRFMAQVELRKATNASVKAEALLAIIQGQQNAE